MQFTSTNAKRNNILSLHILLGRYVLMYISIFGIFSTLVYAAILNTFNLTFTYVLHSH